VSLQGNLRDFSVTEILQLLGTQKKTGCLELTWGAERGLVYLQEGAVVATREPNRGEDDALLAFLVKVHRLSDEQFRGVLSIQRESKRDLEDILVKGRYMDPAELGRLVERQILDSLTSLIRWENGAYRFDSAKRWPGLVVTSLSVESSLIEASRRVDEHKRFIATFKDPYQVLGIRDLPDPDEELYDEERELFGIIDGQRTLTEVVSEAPLTEYEAYEALDRMLRAHWLELVGRRDPGILPAQPAAPVATTRSRVTWANELVLLVVVVAGFLGVWYGGQFYQSHINTTVERNDVQVGIRMAQVEHALQLYRLERGTYPKWLDRLVQEEWIEPHTIEIPGHRLEYRARNDGTEYELRLVEDR
jgi:hypothetical protein